MSGRRVSATKSSKSKNELKGRDVITEPTAKRKVWGGGSKRKYGPDVLTDNELMEEARLKADGRGKLAKKDRTMYSELKRRKLIDGLFKSKSRSGTVVKEIIETVESLKNEGKLNEMLEKLSEFDRRLLDLIIQNPKAPNKEQGEKLGVSVATVIHHKKDMLAQLRNEPPARLYKKYANLSDDEIRETIKAMKVENIFQITDCTLKREIYYRKKYFEADFSDAFKKKRKKKRNLHETKLHKLVTEQLEKGYTLKQILMLFSETEQKVVRNVMNETMEYPRHLGIKSRAHYLISINLIGRLKCLAKQDNNVMHEVWGRDDYLEIIDRAKLTDREKHIIIHTQLRYPPLTLKELGDELGLTRERVRQIENKAKRKIKIVLDGKELKRKRRGPKRKYHHLTNEELIEKAKETAESRSELARKGLTMWKELKGREGDLLYEAYGPPKKTGIKKGKYSHLSVDELIKKARETADGRSELFKKDSVLYGELKRREEDLLYKAYGAEKTRGRRKINGEHAGESSKPEKKVKKNRKHLQNLLVKQKR